MASTTNVIIKDPDILGGTPVFRGTRVPLHALFDSLQSGETLAEFLEGFPSVTRGSLSTQPSRNNAFRPFRAIREPGTTTLRGRGKLASEVPVFVLHVFGEFGDQQVSAGIEDALADHFFAFPSSDHVAGI